MSIKGARIYGAALLAFSILFWLFRMLDQVVELPPTFGLHTVLLLVVLVGMEAVLSADNAIALAALVQGLGDVKLERQALNWGLVAAFIMRMGLIFTATWVIRFWQFELAGALYLLWLSINYFISSEDEDEHHHGPRFSSIWQAIPLIAVTDLAFSLDSVTTAIALADEQWLVITGGIIGIIALRFMAELFIRWLQEFEYLEDAGYVTVLLVGLRLLLKVFNDQWVAPEWVMVLTIAIIFAWGFSKRVEEPAADTENVIIVSDRESTLDSLGNGHQSADEYEAVSKLDSVSELESVNGLKKVP